MTTDKVEGVSGEAKPLFIPLKGEYYDAFLSGAKLSEYRAFGPRWNHKTCYTGRRVILSRGYGKSRRMAAKIALVAIVPPTPDFLKIYGPDKQCLKIRLHFDSYDELAPFQPKQSSKEVV